MAENFCVASVFGAEWIVVSQGPFSEHVGATWSAVSRVRVKFIEPERFQNRVTITAEVAVALSSVMTKTTFGFGLVS